MKVLLSTLKFLYLIFPAIVNTLLAYKYNRWVLMLGILASLIGSASKIYKYHGVPIFIGGGIIYLIYMGYSPLNIYSFMGFWLFWSYFISGLALKCREIEKKEQFDRQWQYG